MYQSKLSFILILFLFYNISGLKVEECNEGILPEEVNVQGCEHTPCELILHQTFGFNQTFRSPKYLENIESRIRAFLAFIPVPFPPNPLNSCDSIQNTPCPLAKGEIIEFSYGLLLPDATPAGVSVTVEFSIIDKDNGDKSVVCFKVPVKTKENR